jgi:putative hydrolase of the HAD superfamily
VNAILPPVMLIDLDDTIVSFSSGPRDFWLEAYRAHAHQLPGVGDERFRGAIYRAAEWYWSDRERAHLGRLDLVRARRETVAIALPELYQDYPEILHAIADQMTVEKEKAVVPFPSAIDTLKEFRRRGLRLGLVSNGGSEFQRAKLKRFDLEPLFDAVVIEGEAGFGKPDPRIFRLALQLLDVSADQAWMVGDNLHADVKGAQQVGIFAVWNDPAGAGLQPDSGVRPDRIIRQLGDLLSQETDGIPNG